MATTLTKRDGEILAAVLSEMTEMPTVDFEKVATKLGVAYARNVRSSFKKIWEKLAGGNVSFASKGDDENADEATTPKKNGKTGAKRPAKAAGSTPDADGDDEEGAAMEETPTKKAKTTPKRVRKTPAANGEENATPKKKGRPSTKGTPKAAAKSDVDMNGDATVNATPKMENDEATKDEVQDANRAETGVKHENGEADSNNIFGRPPQTQDEKDAVLFGLTKEQYDNRHTAAPTPKRAVDSDDEV